MTHIKQIEPNLQYPLINFDTRGLFEIYKKIYNAGNGNLRTHEPFKRIVQISHNAYVTASGHLFLDNGSNSIAEFNNVKQVSIGENYIGQNYTGENHIGLVTTDGFLYTKGNNTFGQLGVIPRGNIINKFVKVKQVSCGSTITLVITQGGQIYTFGGSSEMNILGVEKTMSSAKPIKLEVFSDSLADQHKVIQASAGLYHAALVTEQALLYVFGRLGKFYAIPTRIRIDKKVVQVSSGHNHIACLTDDGEIYVSGTTQFFSDTFTKIQGIDKAVQVSCGLSHTAFITTDGLLYTFGSNRYGQLGIPGTAKSNIPILVNDLKNVVQVSYGKSYTGVIVRE